MRRRLVSILLPLILLPLAACEMDPYDHPGTWKLPQGSLGSNDENLRVMIVDPRDLTEGASADGSEGYMAAPPVHTLVSGKRPRLPNMNASTLDSTAGQQQMQPASTGTNGNLEQ